MCVKTSYSLSKDRNQLCKLSKISAKSLIKMVGDTGIEPVTPTMSILLEPVSGCFKKFQI